MNTSIEHRATPQAEHMGILVLQALATAQGRVDLDGLSRTLGLRRTELRTTLSNLHRQGLVDVMRMRPTLQGFALGRAAATLSIKPLRRVPASPISFRAA